MAGGHGPVLYDTVLEHSLVFFFFFFFFWCSYSRSLAVTGVDSTGREKDGKHWTVDKYFMELTFYRWMTRRWWL
ncbi:hypothetical protein B9Z19DRAFT_1083474 [Tuber borchii]|uniref:Uncharacterized protein n=1 Tax=Tuber borchii TaxID=42251 RepID=A0A2T6ZTC2_TUBBO|nr:hypothetical protein B9Z19DRAFT_1083474 [Tuber borchii]